MSFSLAFIGQLPGWKNVVCIMDSHGSFLGSLTGEAGEGCWATSLSLRLDTGRHPCAHPPPSSCMQASRPVVLILQSLSRASFPTASLMQSSAFVHGPVEGAPLASHCTATSHVLLPLEPVTAPSTLVHVPHFSVRALGSPTLVRP